MRFTFCLLILFLCLSGESYATVNPLTTTRPMIIATGDRLAAMQSKLVLSHPSWTYFKDKIDAFAATLPYNKGEFAASNALAYRLTGQVSYLNRAKELFRMVYIDSSSGYYWDYKNRNGFRSGNKWACLTFDWLYNDLSPTERAEFQAAFKVWGQYWVGYVNYDNNFANYRVTDTDETTSLSENLLLLGICLYNDDAYSTTLFDAADAMHNNFVVGVFMNGYMAGGLWAEGSDYSPATMQHWIRSFIINKEARGIAYPNDYVDKAIIAMRHQTFPGYTGMFAYGDIESATDYSLPAHEYRYDLMLALTDATATPGIKNSGINWIKTINDNGTVPSESIYTGIWRVIFEPQTLAYTTETLPEYMHAPGMGFVSMRTSWDDSANSLYFINSKWTVDHQHKDALSFSIMRGGKVITKELSGYGGVSVDSASHNTLLIQNIDKGSSSPTLRPAGDAVTHQVINADDYGYIDAEATQVYNISGYYAQNYTDKVRRKLVFLKPDTLIIHDAIDINPTYAPRWKKYIQRFQSAPLLSEGIYTSTNEGVSLSFKPIYPQSLVTVVDESGLYADNTQVEAPTNQRKWRAEVTPLVDNNNQEFLNVLYFGDGGMPVSAPLVMSPAGRGLVVGQKAVVFYSSDASYTVDATSHYVFGLPPNSNVSVMRGGNEITGSPYNTGSNGVVAFSSDAGIAVYTIGTPAANPDTCDAYHFNLCTTPELCATVTPTAYWYDNACHSEPEPVDPPASAGITVGIGGNTSFDTGGSGSLGVAQ